MIVGMDFGTTNSSAAIFDGERVHLLPLDPANHAPHICRTSIYITRTRDYYLGSNAVNLYFNQNVGRPTRYRKIWVGEIEQVFAELPKFYRDVFVYEDEFSPGRLFLSIKTALRNRDYFGTVFLDQWYAPNDLATIFLMGMKLRMDRHLGAPVEELVLGRPVYFSEDPEEDKVAQSRLLSAAFKAGFKKIYLEYEPVAAALSYEKTIRDKEIVLVFDFGGGTLDFTIMELGDPRRRRVLATGGIPIAGDIFDQRLFRATIPKHLGEGDTFLSGGVQYPIPAHIFDMLTTPQDVLALNTPQNLEMLRSVHQGAVHKEKTHALLRIASSNYALLMFDRIERVKRQLSTHTDTHFAFQAEDFAIEDTITRLNFERAIHKEYEAIRRSLEDTITRSGLRPKDIDRVIRTGGSSQIPLFGRMLHHIFGYSKVHEIDVFSSVTSGLAIRAHEISTGLEGGRAYTPDSLLDGEALTSGKPKNQEVNAIDLGVVRQRIEVEQGVREGYHRLPDQVLIFLTSDGLNLIPVEDSRSLLHQKTLEPYGIPLENVRRILLAGTDKRVLFATNQFKLINVEVKALYMAAQVSGDATRDLLRLESGEFVTAMIPWGAEQRSQRHLCLVTHYGQARCFDTALLDDYLSKTPFFELERRYVGFPLNLLPVPPDSAILASTTSGRAAAVLRKDMGLQVYDLIKTRGQEEVSSAAVAAPGSQVIALSDQGWVMKIPVNPLPPNTSPASRGTTLRRNFSIVRFFSAGEKVDSPLTLFSSQGRLFNIHLPGMDDELKPIRFLKLRSGERMIGCL